MNKKFILFLLAVGYLYIALLIKKNGHGLKLGYRIPTTKTSPIWLIVISGLESKTSEICSQAPQTTETFHPQVSLFKAAASVALLCLAASRMSKSKSKASIRYAVVGMTTSTTNPCTQKHPSKSSTDGRLVAIRPS